MAKNCLIAASILNANFLNLQKQITKAVQAGIDWIHYDVMDYRLVPNLSFGSHILQNITDHFNIFMDVHLMVDVPAKANLKTYFTPFVAAGASQLTVQWSGFKSAAQRHSFIKLKSHYQVKLGFAITVDDDINHILELLPQIDIITVMSIKPGFGGQKFQMSSLALIKKLRAHIDQNNYKTMLAVDGGINPDTGALCLQAGCNVLVVGSFIFSNNSYKKAVKQIRYAT